MSTASDAFVIQEFRTRRDALIRAGVASEVATFQAHRDFPAAQEILRRADVTHANVMEKEEQAEICKIARALGCTVRSTSQARAAKVAPGIPDLIISHRTRQFFGWWETKRSQGGKWSTAQVEFGDDCLAATLPYGYGDRYAFAAWLTQYGFTPPTLP